MDVHFRKCWGCGNIAEHLDSVVPHVLCKQCGSQDTRRIKTRVIQVSDIDKLREALRQIREIVDDKNYSHMPSGFFTSAVTRVNDVLKRCEKEKLI